MLFSAQRRAGAAGRALCVRAADSGNGPEKLLKKALDFVYISVL